MSWRCRFASLLILALIGLAVVAGVQRLGSRPYNLLILTVESWRIDALRPQVMPELLEAAREGRWFQNHRSISAWTIPNIVALLTGVSPFAQGIHSRADALAPDPAAPLARLGREGWQVRGLQAFMQIEGFSNLGLAIETGEELMPWLARRALDRRPFVVWYHYLDTHLPYAPVEPFRPDWEALLPPDDPGARARVETVLRQPVIPAGSVAFAAGDAPAIAALHDGTYRQFDHWFGRLRDFLFRSGLADDTIVVLTADHGDEHLERGQVGHASTHRAGHLHEEVVRVPLLLWLPARHPDAGRARGVEADPTDHLLVMPTLTRLIRGDFDRPGGLLAPEPARPWMALTSRGGFSEPDPATADVFIGSRIERATKLMMTLEGERVAARTWYDLANDPLERQPLAVPPPAAVRLEAALLAALRGRAAPRRALPPADGTAADPPLSEPPRWLWPDRDGAFPYQALQDRFTLAWTGMAGENADTGRYQIEYQAGDGAMQFSGTIEVTGTTKSFGHITPAYWRTFVVPYGRVRLRVGRGGVWSAWREVRPEP